jgi:hypothetical protein
MAHTLNHRERVCKTYQELYDSVKTILPGMFKPVYETDDGKAEEKVIEMPTDPLVYFVETWYPHMAPASLCDATYFQNTAVDLFPELEFKEIMKRLMPVNRETVWDYLHSMFALSISTPHVKTQYGEIKEDFSEEKKELYEKIRKTVEDFPILVANLVSRKRESRARAQAPRPPPELNEAFFENSALGTLAREISEEVNPEDVLNMD